MAFETTLGYVRLRSENHNKPACFSFFFPPFPLRRQFIVPTNAVSPICALSFSCPMSPSLPAPGWGIVTLLHLSYPWTSRIALQLGFLR